jgi:hypothetical protein
MSNERRLVSGNDWDYTPVVAPACEATFIELPKPQNHGGEQP